MNNEAEQNSALVKSTTFILKQPSKNLCGTFFCNMVTLDDRVFLPNVKCFPF